MFHAYNHVQNAESEMQATECHPSQKKNIFFFWGGGGDFPPFKVGHG
jgi:hypothetical protein